MVLVLSFSLCLSLLFPLTITTAFVVFPVPFRQQLRCHVNDNPKWCCKNKNPVHTGGWTAAAAAPSYSAGRRAQSPQTPPPSSSSSSFFLLASPKDNREEQDPAEMEVSSRSREETNVDTSLDSSSSSSDAVSPLLLFQSISQQLQNDNSILEIRSDVTLAACYSLCRFLMFDITTGAKSVPGWQLSDWIMLAGAFSSCMVLGLLWTAVGLAMGLFVENDDDNICTTSIHSWKKNTLGKTAATACLVGPLWLLVETICGWPPAGVTLVVNGLDEITMTTSGGGGGAILIMESFLQSTVATSLGLAAVMCLGKTFVSSGERWR